MLLKLIYSKLTAAYLYDSLLNTEQKHYVLLMLYQKIVAENFLLYGRFKPQ